MTNAGQYKKSSGDTIRCYREGCEGKGLRRGHLLSVEYNFASLDADTTIVNDTRGLA